MKKLALLAMAALLLQSCKKEVKVDETAKPVDSTEVKELKSVMAGDSLECIASFINMYDIQGSITNKSCEIILPKLKNGKQYNIHAMYNVSSNGQNRVLIHLTDTQNTMPQSVIQKVYTFPFHLSSIIDISGAQPIDDANEICIGILHENDTVYFNKIKTYADRVYDATRKRLICDGMTYQQLFGDDSPAEQGDPKRCGSGTVQP